jgi:hypothetical protein
MAVPAFPLLLGNFPKMSSVVEFKRFIGGGADDTSDPPDQQWLGGANGDTCTLRMSRALNYSGVPVPADYPGLRTVRGGDGRRYAFAVQELHHWLLHRFGDPDVYVKGKPVARDRFAGRPGIMLFDIVFGLNADGVTRALGHVDLWDGRTFFDELEGVSSPERDFFDIANGVSLWFAPAGDAPAASWPSV